jgi:signal transduction histidine kinase
MRIRYRLEGYEDRWHDSDCEMKIGVRFYNVSGDQVGEKFFSVTGDSAGWRQSLATSPLTHRRELIVCPPNTDQFWVVISSAGPPSAVGTYVVANLKVFKMATNGVLIPAMPPLDEDLESSSDETVRNWQQDGGRPSMAKVVNVGEPPQKALAIVDTDGTTHAEWHTTHGFSPKAHPGDQLLLEWDEMFSIGVCDLATAFFGKLPTGNYVLHVEYFDVLDRPTGIQGRLTVLVPPPLWSRTWFWPAVGIPSAALMAMVGRYLNSRRMRRELNRLKWQRALEQERLRIARDIHDDLGARLTEVSLKSALAKGKYDLPPAVAEDFEQISTLCRDLVASLYATVWTVNPKNDNLNALGEFLCQIALRLSDQAQFACRLEVPSLPKDIEISSRVRHNLAMLVTEAIHNVIKHAGATELCLKVSFEAGVLVILVEDNGCGFDPARAPVGNGLKNMKDRLASVGGTCLIENRPKGGTTVRMQISIKKRSLQSYEDEIRPSI